MDELDRYLDQICRGVAGPRALRQHIRQELGEHLRDAVAGHRAAGMTEADAVARAIEDFGGPDAVRAELLAAHGQRFMTVVIDRTIQWKEATMKARWLWTTWAHLALVGMIALNVALILFVTTALVPMHRNLLMRDGLFPELHVSERNFLTWSWSFLGELPTLSDGLWWAGGAAAAIALFEWRVRGENKSLVRLSLLGTTALGLTGVVALTLFALVVSAQVTVMGLYVQAPEKRVAAQTAGVDASVAALEQAVAQKDWDEIRYKANSAALEMGKLTRAGAFAPTLVAMQQQSKTDDLRAQLKTAQASLREAYEAAGKKDAPGVDAALKKFHEAYSPVEGIAAKK
ncbi:permease prefix domain 1-containing protein [Fimbriiglobus ruber]|uniref:Transmembrane protein n=1 Tax=Fimbriiglobus ruber TaxID=1908690 RepID=A0A225DJY7_9BACT|nr:permease prefix domain 1-containing protein [Fimbriiglobus ruber]OWK37509.1 hypothetical protein FRUB_06629 [Fimbriiglobus ruber]